MCDHGHGIIQVDTQLKTVTLPLPESLFHYTEVGLLMLDFSLAKVWGGPEEIALCCC